jgi:protein-disulfide isomerase
MWIALVTMTLLLLTVACTRQITGTARQDPNQPRTAVTEDGFGILAGDPDASAQIELFTEPQCPHCAILQADFGSEIASYIGLGQLAVTYRPVTFLDQSGDHSARVSNAMFAAADVAPRAVAFQAFVEDLWAHQQPGGTGPSNDEMAEMAQRSGIPAPGVTAIKGGGEAVDTQDMSDLNVELLAEINSQQVGTPTVYDLVNNEVVDISDQNWVSKLISTH